MFILYGKRKARIKRYTDNQQACKSCQVFDLDVKVYRSYYHLFFIPVFPVGLKTVTIRCRNCGEPMRLEVIQNHYEHITKTPFYLFSFPILMAGLIAIFINYNSKTQKEKAIFSASPIVGDVYTITKEENNKTTYYFLRIARISGDTVVAYHNKYEYNGYVSGMNNEDFFVKDDLLYFLKPELKQMVDKMEINSIDRVYGDEEGFNRIR